MLLSSLVNTATTSTHHFMYWKFITQSQHLWKWKMTQIMKSWGCTWTYHLPFHYICPVMFHCMLHSKFHIVYNFESGLRSQKFTLIKLLLESFHIEFYFQRNNDKLCIFIIQKIFYICTGFLGITMHLILSLCLIKIPP